VVADSIEQAVEDLGRDWSAERRLAWAIDSGTRVHDARAVETHGRVAPPMRSALRRARMAAELAAIVAVVPPDPSTELRAAEMERRRLDRQREELASRTGRYRQTPVGEAMQELQRAESNVRRLERNVERRSGTRKDRRSWRSELGEWRDRSSAAAAKVESLAGPEYAQLRTAKAKIDHRIDELHRGHERRRAWQQRHPEVALRIDQLTTEIERLDASLDRARGAIDRPTGRESPLTRHLPPPTLDRGLDLGR
jgi:DNA repair exonuclease SbcCD ATPase subunit